MARHRRNQTTHLKRDSSVFEREFMSALSALVALFSAIALWANYLGTAEAKRPAYLPAGPSVYV
jgi:hypothetical protein